MGAASVLMGSGSSDAGITPLWVIPLTTQGPAGHLCLDRSTPSSLLPLPSPLLLPIMAKQSPLSEPHLQGALAQPKKTGFPKQADGEHHRGAK